MLTFKPTKSLAIPRMHRICTLSLQGKAFACYSMNHCCLVCQETRVHRRWEKSRCFRACSVSLVPFLSSCHFFLPLLFFPLIIFSCSSPSLLLPYLLSALTATFFGTPSLVLFTLLTLAPLPSCTACCASLCFSSHR